MQRRPASLRRHLHLLGLPGGGGGDGPVSPPGDRIERRRSNDPSQLVLYREALRIPGYPGAGEAEVRYVVLLKTKEPDVDVQEPQLDGGELKRLLGLYRAAWQSIRNGASHPVPGWWCRDCQWKHKCDQA